MRSTMRTGCAALLAAGALCMLPAKAQEPWPAAPVRLVAPFAPGGSADTVARLLAQKLQAQLGGNVIVENRDGATGNIGAEYVARCRPDGYCLLVNTISIVLSPAFGEKLGYDLMRDLVPVSMVASTPFVLVTHAAVPGNSVPELVSYIRANPDKVAYSSAGTGNTSHLGPLLFLQANNISALHVPYKGGAPSLQDLLAGRVQFSMQVPPSIIPLMKDKRLKVLAVTSLKRLSTMAEIPTLAESGMPGFDLTTWFGVLAPAKLPPAIIRRANEAVAGALADADMRARLAQQGFEPRPSSPEEYGSHIRSELERFTRLIRSAGVKLDQ